MIKYIYEVTREYGIEHHTLRNWEDKGYLGDVEKDFTHGRMYTEDQLNRIKVIQKVVKSQQEKGMKRTDFKEVERVLLDEFGGMVETRPSSIHATPEAFTNMLLKLEKQDKQIQTLQQMVLELTNVTKELPSTRDGEEMDKVLDELAASKEREQEREKTMEDMNEKLQKAVDFILEMENKEKNKEVEDKRGFFKRIFG